MGCRVTVGRGEERRVIRLLACTMLIYRPDPVHPSGLGACVWTLFFQTKNPHD